MKVNEAIQSEPLSPLIISFLSVFIGVVAGLGAVVFRGLIALFHNLLFLGKLSVVYNANIHTPPGPWGILIIFVPVLGAVGVVFLVKNFAPEAKGHGVPEVMDAIYYNKGIIRPVVAVVKSVASALSIGSGGAVGREGPIIQIGSSFGSSLGQIFPMPIWQRINLISAGAAAGIAATFNTPIGGVLFALEIMMHEVSARTLVPVAISTATATYIARIFFGSYPSFLIPELEGHYFHLANPLVLVSYVGLGVLMGLFSTLFIKSIYAFEDLFTKRVKGNYYIQHMTGMFMVGIMMYLLMITTGHYYIEGVGYSTIQDILSGRQSQLYLLILLFFLKLLAVSLTLGSGASGGIFSPALYMGATMGGAYGIILHQAFPSFTISPPAFAAAGMAAMIGGSTGAAMAAIVMIFEMTLDYNVIIPITVTVAFSYGVRKILSKDSIYTLKLARRGHYVPEALQANVYHVKRVKDMMETRLTLVPASGTLDEFAQMLSEQMAVSNFLVKDAGKIVGLITKDVAIEALGRRGEISTLGEISDRGFITVSEDSTLFEVIARMRSGRASAALVIRDGETISDSTVVGVVTKEHIADAMIDAVELFTN
ncbi:H(+)/Cl(-) exchange transporter ClcA [bacterium BMS3Bbin06]|nr:H(+)/Cl(-) exchange transporter ClcA [bacterium BMS3Abin08]GBE34821.1 H(+)/Cl(-) exchange transporter ClcA [bacterium BMS3Bbin06]